MIMIVMVLIGQTRPPLILILIGFVCLQLIISRDGLVIVIIVIDLYRISPVGFEICSLNRLCAIMSVFVVVMFVVAIFVVVTFSY